MELWKKAAVVLWIALLQLSVVGYLLSSFVGFWWAEPQYLPLVVVMFVLSLVPVLLSVLFGFGVLTKKKLLLGLVAFTVLVVVLVGDFRPPVHGTVLNEFTQQPMSASVCTSMFGPSLFPMAHNPGDPLISTSCTVASADGQYNIPAEYSFDPFAYPGMQRVIVRSGAFEDYIDTSIPFYPHLLPLRVNISVRPSNYSYEDCLDLEDEQARDCAQRHAFTYAVSTGERRECTYARNTSACLRYLEVVERHTTTPGEYGFCYSDCHLDSIRAFWEQNASLVTRSVQIRRWNRSTALTCAFMNTSAPVFVVGEACGASYIYKDGDIYSSREKYAWAFSDRDEILVAITDESLERAEPVIVENTTIPPAHLPDPAECETIEGQPSTKMGCYTRAAIALRDPSLCEKTKHDMRDMCYLDLARETGNATYCEEIVSSMRRERCP